MENGWRERRKGIEKEWKKGRGLRRACATAGKYCRWSAKPTTAVYTASTTNILKLCWLLCTELCISRYVRNDSCLWLSCAFLILWEMTAVMICVVKYYAFLVVREMTAVKNCVVRCGAFLVLRNVSYYDLCCEMLCISCCHRNDSC